MSFAYFISRVKNEDNFRPKLITNQINSYINCGVHIYCIAE